MAGKLAWGVLGAARIALEKVIPAIQNSVSGEVVAIASREADRARACAERLGIPRAYGSYEELLADPQIDAVYNPLPNHLHVPWSIRAAERGKHVLCEKPIALDSGEVASLIEARDRTGVRIQEAFMVRTHPQWLTVRDLVRAGRVGRLRAVTGHFSYFNDDPANVRNVAAFGGGGVMDIGCYPITIARFLFGEEPQRAIASAEHDARFGTDILTSAILEFPSGQCSFTCSTQLVPYQRLQLFGTTARIDVQIPFNAPNDRPCRVFVDDGSDLFGGGVETLSFDVCDQYTLQADLFVRAVREGGGVPVPLEDSLANMKAIEAVLRSAESGGWERP